MALSVEFKDFYIKYKGHPSFSDHELIEDEVIKVIIQKYEMILFTNKTELFGDPDFGADLILLLYETKVSGDFVKTEIIKQINTYIPEIANANYTLDVVFSQDPENAQDIMYTYFNIADFEVFAQIGKRYA
jgi:hypothetical protein